MSQEDLDVSQWIALYVSTTSTQEQERNAAAQLIEQQMNQNPMASLLTSLSILRASIDDPHTERMAKCQAAILLSHVLKLRNPEDLQQKRLLLENSPLVDTFQQVLKAHIFSPEKPIRNSCAQTFAILFVILGKQWLEIFHQLIELLSEEVAQTNYCVINVMQEIITQPAFVHELAQNIQQEILHVALICSKLLGKPKESGITDDDRLISATFLYQLLLIYPPIFGSGPDALNKAKYILELMANSIHTPNRDLYEKQLQLIGALVRAFYPGMNEFKGMITQYASVGLQTSVDKALVNTQLVNISLYFWKEIASLEKKIRDKYRIYQQKNSRKLEEPFRPLDPAFTDFTFMSTCIEHLSKYLDETDGNVERPLELPQPNMFATVTLQSFYELQPKEVFEHLQSAIEQLIYQPKTWVDVHSALLLMYAVLGEPLNDRVGQYISQYYDHIINCCLADRPPRLRETALFTLSLLIKNYPQCISQLSVEDAKHRIEAILQLFETMISPITPQTPLTFDDFTIFSRCVIVIGRLASVYKSNPYNNQLTAYFDRFMALARRFFAIGQLNGAHDLISHSGQAISQLIIYSPYEVKNKLTGLYQEIMSDFENLTQFGIENSISFLIQAEYCTIITGFVLRFSNGKQYSFIEQIAPRTLEKLFRLLSNRDCKIYEEALMTISSFIKATNDIQGQKIFGPENMDTILHQFIYDGLTSGSPQVIIAASFLLGQIYNSGIAPADYLFRNFERFYNLLGQLLLNFDNRDVYPTLLRAIGEMFLSPQFANQDQNPLAANMLEVNGEPVGQSLRELLLMVTGQLEQVDLTNKEDVRYGNQFAKYLSLMYGGYAKNFYCIDNFNIERQQLLLLDKLAQTIYKMYPKIDPEVVQQFAATCILFGEHCSRKNNVILNRASIHRLLKVLSEEPDVNADPQILKKAKDAIDFIKNK